MKLLFSLLLFASTAQAGNIAVGGPFSGLNDTDSSITIQPAEAQDTLNVEVSNDGMALKKRKGYSLNSTLTTSTMPITGSAYFKTASGNNIKLFAHDSYLSASTNGGAFTNIYTTAPVSGRWSFCISDGKAYAFNSSTYSFTPFSYDGTSLTYYPSFPKASLCAMTVDRMLLAGTTDYPNRLYFSKSGAITNFTVGVNPEDPGFEDIGLPGEKITNIFTTQAEWLIFKTNSMTSYQGSNQFDLTPSVISEKIGMIEPYAIVQNEGIVYFKSTSGKIYGYKSGTLSEISRNISGIVGDITKDGVLTKVYSEKTDFDTGTFYKANSSDFNGSVSPTQFTSTDTTTEDFLAGTLSSSATVNAGTLLLSSLNTTISSWTSRTLPEDIFNSKSIIAYGNGVFVAVGQSKSATSTDGVTWSTHSLPVSSAWTSIACGNGIFLAISASSGYQTMSSPDGITWTIKSSLSANGGWNKIAYGNGIFVAAGTGGSIAYSTDGGSWSLVFVGTGLGYGLTFGNGMFINLGSDLISISTTVGVWTNYDPGTPNPYIWSGATYGNLKFVATTASTGTTMGSIDGITWSTSTTVGSVGLGNIIYADGLYIALRYNSSDQLETSFNGVNWSTMSIPNAQFKGIAYGNNIVVATSFTETIITADITSYSSTGSFISQAHVIDPTRTSTPTYYGYISYTSSVPAGTSISWYVRNSTSTTGTFSAWSATTDYLLISSTNTVWEYKADLTMTTASLTSPSISDVTLLFKTTGYWESPEYNMGGFSSWGVFNADSTLDSAASYTYKIYVATFSGGTATAAAESLTDGALITASTGTYSKIRATNAFTTATETVRMDGISYSWSRNPDKMANGFEYKGDIYFSVPYNNSLSNNRVLKLDTKSNGWQIFDIPLNSPLSIGEDVYFGSTTGGYVYQYPVGDSDNGSAINSYWKTKNYIGDNPYVEKNFDKLSLIVGSDYGSSLDITYTMDTATSTSYSISLTSNTANFVRDNRQLEDGAIGTFFNMQLGNNAANQPWSFYGANIDYKNDPWRVIP